MTRAWAGIGSHPPRAGAPARCWRLPVLGLLAALLLPLLGAAPAGAAVTFTGSVDAAGVSFRAHTFDVRAPATISAGLGWDSETADLNLFLYDPDGVQRASAVGGATKPERLTFEATASGTWKLGVKAKTGAATYTLSVANAPTGTSGGGDWPMFHHDPAHTGVAPSTAIGSTTAGSLGVQWQAQTGEASFSSPVVARSASLGRSLVYVGNLNGTVSAYDTVTGRRVWAQQVAGQVNSSGAVHDGVLYIGAASHRLHALDASTGAPLCSFDTGGVVSAAPVVADPGGGPLVFVGDNGVSGTDDGGHFWAINPVRPGAPVDCSRRWSFSGFGAPAAGSWSPPAFGRDRNGRPLVVFGSSSPDNSVYALDARTGVLAWKFETEFSPDGDVGAGPTISAPGVNGLADGAVYVAGKNKILYAFDLTTGRKMWEFRIISDSPTAGGWTRSTAALVGRRLYLGYGAGVYAIDAVTGAKVWRTPDRSPRTAEVISSPAVSGAGNDRVVFVGDVDGWVYGFDLATGARLWARQTGGPVYSSPAVVGNRLFVSSGDGFLYAFALPSPGNAPPDTAITSPAAGEIVANPGGELTVTGTASDDTGVARVYVSVKDISKGRWWDAATRTWSQVFAEQPATSTGTPGPRVTWRLRFPVPFDGASYRVLASAVDVDGRRDPLWADVRFTVGSAGNPPETTITAPTNKQIFRYPDNVKQSFPITIRGTATDSGGATRGVREVVVSVKNREHNEYFCGAPGCASGGSDAGSAWGPAFAQLPATLANPGAVTTTWTLTFPSYNHDHSYSAMAQAVDLDGERDSTRALVSPFCVRLLGDNNCF